LSSPQIPNEHVVCDLSTTIQMEIFSYSKLHFKMVRNATLLKDIVKKNLHTYDLKSVQLPNVTNNNIQISKTLSSVMGSIMKVNFEEKI
jgi:DNA-directed RNA polymerase subunit H (RpoH/RPB5)